MEIYRGKRLSIEIKDVHLPDGRSRERVIVHPGDAVAILPKGDNDILYLLRQYRYAIDAYIYEAPAGTMIEGELPEETARRELIEETGFSARHFRKRGIVYSTPGFTDERLHLFEAEGLFPSSEYRKDDDEIIELVPMSIPEFRSMCIDGRISDAKTICLAYRCLQG
ncbi:MAG: NUDIX hydrolase [Methanoregulaceae archaeon]|nr:NUDIX hydrolase [Methanoregulaceae archaeon]